MGIGVRQAAAALAAFVVLAGVASAQVPDPFARQLAAHLSRIDQIVARQNYARAAGPFAGGLNQRQSQRFTVTLRAGQDYRIVGVCDARCTDLNMRLIDPQNFVLDEDALNDAVPVLSVRPNVTGQHTIEASMARCADAPCYFAFNVYTR